MDIRLYYVDGCPSYLRALKNLNEALATPIKRFTLQQRTRTLRRSASSDHLAA